MKHSLAVFISLLLAACVGSRPEPPASASVTPPSVWRTNLGPGGDVGTDWWTEFGDPTLTRIVEHALSANNDVALAAVRVQDARARFHLAQAEQRPNLTGDAGGAREHVIDSFGVGITQYAGQAEVSIAYDLDLFGRLASDTAAARAELLASEDARDNVRLAVASDAARGYITLRALDDRLAVLLDTLANRAASLKIARRRAETGYASRLELEQADSEYRATNQLIPVAKLAISQQEDAISTLVGDNPGPVSRGSDLGAITSPPMPARMPSALLRRRPDIITAEQKIIAADHSLDAARAAFMPDVTIGASGGFAAARLLVLNPTELFSVGGSVLTPILDGGRLRAKEDISAAERDQAAFIYRKTALNAFREVEDSMAAVHRTSEEIGAVTAQRDSLARTLRLATHRYLEGYSPYLDQIDAQRGLLAAELNLIQARADHLNAFVTLYQAMGGGWSSPFPDRVN
jgi:multidrug efflux system outer membrane protein